VAAALQFPYYFGENWDADARLLADLAWLNADAMVICIADARSTSRQAPRRLEEAHRSSAIRGQGTKSNQRSENCPRLSRRSASRAPDMTQP